MRVSMKLSFDDQESFKETTGSLRFNNYNPSSDPNIILHQMGSISADSAHDSERYEDT